MVSGAACNSTQAEPTPQAIEYRLPPATAVREETGHGMADVLAPGPLLPDVAVADVGGDPHPPLPSPPGAGASAAENVPPPTGEVGGDGYAGILRAAGWPDELIPAALSVAFCESRHRFDAMGDNGRSAGWFQLAWLWFGYAGESADDWADPLVNARAALAAYRYDIARGHPPWRQWTCQP